MYSPYIAPRQAAWKRESIGRGEGQRPGGHVKGRRIIPLIQRSPAPGSLTGTSCQISSGIRLEIKYIINVMCLNHGFPCGSDGKASACNVGDPGSIPGLGRSPGEGNGNPLQYPCLENPMDRGTYPWGRLSHPETIPPPRSVEKLSSMKPVLGAKKVGDCCLIQG